MMMYNEIVQRELNSINITEVDFMAKISKNIKRLRTARNLSQDDLAKALFISRQAVSSWEVGRTQPDIEMIGKLSEFFAVPTEELLYGEKRNTALEESVKTKKVLSVIFAVLGSLLVGVGIMIILIGLWEDFSHIIKSVVSFIPLLVGQGAAYFVYKKKFQEISWREGGAVLWSVGVIATVGLMSIVNNLYLGVTICLLIDAIMILPIIYIFKVVSPLALYYGFAISGVIGLVDRLSNKYAVVDTGSFLFINILAGLLIVAGILVIRVNKDEIIPDLLDAGVWLSAIAVIALGIFDCVQFGTYGVLVFIFVSMFILSKKETWLQPFYPVGVLGTCITSVLSTYYCMTEYVRLEKFDKSVLTVEFFGAIIVSVIIALIGFGLGKNNVQKQPLKLGFGCCGIAIGLLMNLFDIPAIALVASVAVFVLTFIEGAILIIKGANEKSYFTMNVGIVTILVLLFQILLTIELTLVTVGLMLLLSGGSLLTANVYITKQIKKEQAELDARRAEEEADAES